jgi:hypothetical protein
MNGLLDSDDDEVTKREWHRWQALCISIEWGWLDLLMHHGEHGGENYRCDVCGDDEFGI